MKLTIAASLKGNEIIIVLKLFCLTYFDSQAFYGMIEFYPIFANLAINWLIFP